MRTLNVKRTIILLVVVLVLAGSTELLHSYQVQRKSASFRIQAEAAWNATPKREKDAITLMTAYLKLAPRDLDAREKLGFWCVDAGRFSFATTVLEELVRTLEKQQAPGTGRPDVPRIQKVRRKLIDADAVQGRFPDAIYHLEILHKEYQQQALQEKLKYLPDDVDVLKMLGRCKVMLGREEEAVKDYDRAIELDPKRFDIYYAKAMALYYRLSKKEEAKKCMADMIAYWNNPQSQKDLGEQWKNPAIGAHQVYGTWLADLGQQGEPGQFENALEQAKITLNLQKDHPGGLYLAGQAELALHRFSEAEEHVQKGIDVAPQDFAMYTLMADVLVHSNRRDRAIETLKKGLLKVQSNDKKAQILWHLANLYLDKTGNLGSKNIDDALKCMEQMRQYQLSPVQVAFLDARVQYAKEDWKQARERFEKVRGKMNEIPQLMKCLDYWIGYCYLQQGNPDQAMAAFRRSLSFDKFYFKAHEGIAQIFVGNNQFKDAAEEYYQAWIGNKIDMEATIAYARSLVLLNLHRSAAEQKWEQLEDVLQQARKVDPKEGQIPLLWAEMLLDRGMADQANRMIKDLRTNAPEGEDFCVAQARLLARQGQTEMAQKILAEARGKWGDSVQIRLTQAVLALRATGFRAGAEIEGLADNADAFSLEERTRLWGGLLNNLLEIREYDRAKRLCKQIADLQQRDAMIRYRLFELALVTHDTHDPAASLAELDRVLGQIDVLAGQGPLWWYGKGVRLMLEAAQGKPELLDAAMDCASQAQRMRLSWSRPHVLKGEICRRQGKNEDALEHYLQASIAGDQDLEFIRLLLQMLLERQRYQEAEQVIHRLDNSQTPMTHDIEVDVARVFALFGDFNRALECADGAYNPGSRDYQEHLWHGQVLKLLYRRAQREGHPDKLPKIAAEAENSFRRACQIAPNAAECRVELVQLLVATNQMEKARIAGDDAYQMISSLLAKGYIHEALGEAKEAGQCYEKAVKTMPGQPQAIQVLADYYIRRQDAPRALPLIERFFNGELQPSESDLVAARRMKAKILATQGYSKLKEAIALIDRNLASSLTSPQDKRLKLGLLLADPLQARSDEALELAKSLVATGGAEPDPDDRLQLARLYLARNEWEPCREEMQRLVNGSQPNPTHLAIYVRMLLDQDLLGDAELLLDRLEHVSDPALAVPLRGELLHRSKEWGKVPEFFAGYVKQAKPGSKEWRDRVLLAARLIEHFGELLTAAEQKGLKDTYFEAAREWYEAYADHGYMVPERPGSDMLLAGFHARHGKIEEALQGIERYGQKSDPREVFRVVDAIVARPGITKAQLQRLETLIVALLDKMQRSAPLLISLAETQAALGRPQDSEKVYREILGKDPSDVAACNNLSLILALQKTKLDEALALVNKAIEGYGPQGAFLDTRAVIWIARHEPRRAIEDLDAALAQKATPVRLFHKAWAYYEDGNAGKARELLQAANNANQKAMNANLDEGSILSQPEQVIYRQILAKAEN